MPLYETFVEGAKEGFKVAVGIIPYLVAMLVAIGSLARQRGPRPGFSTGSLGRRSGSGFDSRWVDGLPTGSCDRCRAAALAA